jgi:glutamine synthetase
MSAPPITAADVLKDLEKRGDRRIKVAITDIDGVLRGKYLHPSKLKSALSSSFGFCDVIFGWDSADKAYEGAAFTGWHTGYPDALVQLDPSTYRRIPWEDDVPFLLGDFIDPDGGPLAVCPRKLLRAQVAKAADMGYGAKFGMEFEWFNFREKPEDLHARGFHKPQPITPGMFGYSLLRQSQNPDFFRDLMLKLDDFRVPIEGLHTETGPGVYEAAILYCDALEAADRAALFKTGAKEIAYRHGIMASFMAKWNPKLPGCSGHMHQSLWYQGGAQDGKAVFYDPDDPQGVSRTFRHYIAGQLRLLPEMCALFAPTVNSYKRLVEGMWAPTRCTWGVDNRTVALRVISGGAKSTRLETRVPGADVNPYLAIAAGLAMGLWGIENQIEPDRPAVKGNGYTAEAPVLPANLAEAADALDRSEVARQIFGDTFIDHFVATRRWEWREYSLSVSDWELQRYFEII